MSEADGVLPYLDRVQRGIDFVEAHLEVDFELQDVARAAGLSCWHFQRIFKALTQETLKTYIRSRRFSRALGLLKDTDLSVLDIALACGFETHESFTRAFKACFRITPNHYRQAGHVQQFVKKAQFDANYLRHVQHQVSLEPEVAQRPALRLVGLQTVIFGVGSAKNNVSKKLPPLWSAFLSRLTEVADAVPGCCYGVISPMTDGSGRLQYLAGIEVRHDAVVPAGMTVIQLPSARQARFTHRGPVQQLDHTVNYIYGNWLLTSGHTARDQCDLEIYGPQYGDGGIDSVMHYAITLD